MPNAPVAAGAATSATPGASPSVNTPGRPVSPVGRRSAGAVVGKNAAISGAIGGAVAATAGSILAGAISAGGSDKVAPVVFVTLVSMMLGAVLVSWQSFASGAWAGGVRRLVVGAALGAVAGVVALLPANAIYGSTTEVIGTTTFEDGTYLLFDTPPTLSGAVWAVVAALVGLLIGSLRGVRAAAAASVGGAVAGFFGGLLFGANVAEFRGHLLLVDGLDGLTILIVAAIGLVVGLSIGLVGRVTTKARLVIIEGRSKGIETLLPAKRATIGSASSDTLVLAGDKLVAAKHVTLDLSAGTPTAVVSPTARAIRINGNETMEAELHDGDVMTIGESFVRFEYRGGNP